MAPKKSSNPPPLRKKSTLHCVPCMIYLTKSAKYIVKMGINFAGYFPTFQACYHYLQTLFATFVWYVLLRASTKYLRHNQPLKTSKIQVSNIFKRFVFYCWYTLLCAIKEVYAGAKGRELYKSRQCYSRYGHIHVSLIICE